LKELLELAWGLLRFEEAVAAVRQLTFPLNEELMDVIRCLQLQWHLTLTSPNERVILIDGMEDAEKPVCLALPKKKSAVKSPRRRG
jgi:hypothetical protein